MGDVVKKVCQVIDEMGVIPKTGRNKFQGYDYRKHEDIMSKLQLALVKNNLVFYPKEKKLVSNEIIEKTNKNGEVTKNSHVIIEVKYVLTDGESSIDFMGLGEGIDNGDKAIYKAQTGATKYALNDLLMLASEMDAEAHDVQIKPNTTTNKPSPVKESSNTYDSHTNKVNATDEDTIIDLCASLDIKHENKLIKAKAIGASKVIEELKNMKKEG
jgi:hypothetical protein